MGSVQCEFIEVNPNTNKIYAISLGSQQLLVIDGATNTATTSIAAASGAGAGALIVNPINNQIYFNNGYASVGVLDGNTNGYIGNIGVTSRLSGLAYNPLTNILYNTDIANSILYAISGTPGVGVLAQLPLNSPSNCVGVNSKTNMIYAAVINNSNLVVINGATNSLVSNIALDSAGQYISINENTNTVYVSTLQSLTIINGQLNNVIASIPIANPRGNRSSSSTANYSNISSNGWQYVDVDNLYQNIVFPRLNPHQFYLLIR
jgi:DNA-binding beta-propeller fold protein YncE